MKIAFIVSKFPSLSETFILNQITGLIDMGHEIEIFASNKSKDQKIHPEIEKYGLMEKVYYIKKPKNKLIRIIKGIWLFFSYFHKAPKKIINSLNIIKYKKNAVSLSLLYYVIPFINKKFDIIYCHFGPNGKIGLKLKEVGVKGKLITSFHGYDLSSYLKINGENTYEDLFRKGDLFLPISDYWENKLLELGCNKNRILVHRMGINLDKFIYHEKILKQGETIKLLTVGRLVEKKGHKYVIEALSKIIKKHNNIIYYIAGDGPLEDELIALSKRLKVDKHIKFLGSLRQDEIIKLFKNSHIFILASSTAENGDQEGIPVVLMEAQAVGLPIISTYHSGITELVLDEKSGFIVPEKDSSALAEKIRYLIEHPEIWSNMGRYGRKIVEKEYNIKILNRQLVKIYENLTVN